MSDFSYEALTFLSFSKHMQMVLWLKMAKQDSENVAPDGWKSFQTISLPLTQCMLGVSQDI